MTDFEQVEDYLAMTAGEVLDSKVEQAIQNGITEITGEASQSVHRFIDARSISLRGRVAAYLNASQRRDPAFKEAMVVADTLAWGGSALDLSVFRYCLLRATFAIEETGYGRYIQR